MEDDDDSLDRPSAEMAGRAGNWELYQKPRPYYRPLRLLGGVLLYLLSWAAGIMGLWGGFMFFRLGGESGRPYLVHALVGLIGYVVFRIWRYAHAVNTKCPLCHGTPLHEKDCRKHRLATKVPGLNYAGSTVASLIFRGRYNCMYCGTPFRLRK
jgi:xanthosine utilization system XapX-like protein